jgi:hypothetical protein
MGLVGDWQQLEAGLPQTWEAAGVYLTLEEPRELERAIVLLAPLQPVRAGAGAISLRISRGGAPGPEAVRRGMLRLDGERIHGTLSTDEIEAAPEAPPEAPPVTLASSWDAALATLPADWSDLLGEIELDSSDYIEPGAIQLAPINPRRVGNESRLQFRSASRFGYGASPGMVRRCLERCDAIGIRGRVEVLRALSGSHPVGTQGPVWQIDGRSV